jgi:phosphatidylserine decarboxylase
VSDRLAVLSQYFLPKQALTALMGKLAQAEAGGLTTAVIRRFIQRYQVNMAEAANPDPAAYKTFNAFLHVRSRTVFVLWRRRTGFAR